MEEDIKEIKKGEKIKPNSFRTSTEGERFKIEFGQFIEEENTVNILSEVEFKTDELALFFKGLLYGMVQYEKKTNIKIFDTIKNLVKEDANEGEDQ